MIRAFLAVELPVGIRENLSSIQHELKNTAAGQLGTNGIDSSDLEVFGVCGPLPDFSNFVGAGINRKQTG